MTNYDPLHAFSELDDDDGAYIDVHRCESCGVVGTIYYRIPYEPCPRCGETRKPTAYIAIWVSQTKARRVPFSWWRPSTWFQATETVGAWIPRDQGAAQ